MIDRPDLLRVLMDSEAVSISVMAGAAKWWMQMRCLPRAWRTTLRTKDRVSLLVLGLALSLACMLTAAASSDARSGLDRSRAGAFLAALGMLEAWASRLGTPSLGSATPPA